MAKTNNTGGSKQAIQPGGNRRVRFIDVPLTASDKAWLEAPDNQDWDGLNDAFDTLSEGYKLGIRWDDRNHTFVASLTDQRAETALVLSGRGSTAANALRSLMYRHVVRLAGDWSTIRDVQPESPDYD